MKFIFLNELLKTEYKNISCYTHLCDLHARTKNGNEKYKLIIYDMKNNPLDDFYVLRLFSKKTGNPYFSVMIPEEGDKQFLGYKDNKKIKTKKIKDMLI